MKDLGIGARGSDVEELQRKLKTLGYQIGAIDGAYGAKTQAAVEAFQSDYMTTGAADVATQEALNRAVANAESRGDFPDVPVGLGAVQRLFGAFQYSERGGGYVEITCDWVARNIVAVDLPIVGRVETHRVMVPIITSVMEEIEEAGLASEVRCLLCFCPRHKMHNPKRGLSIHSWAAAFDVNPSTNMPGKIGDIHPGIVRIFESHGFNWGGRWRNRDDMHFQYARGV